MAGPSPIPLYTNQGTKINSWRGRHHERSREVPVNLPPYFFLICELSISTGILRGPSRKLSSTRTLSLPGSL